jgi:3-hydroxyacyl-CoA dehydrogenase/enoyl-CoA hydratase/3-hydroxybutyryl-CoA epimerase
MASTADLNLAFDALGLTDFTCRRDEDGLAWLAMDCRDSPVNRFSSKVLHELGQALDHFHQYPPAGLVILSAKPSGFIAGADVNEFTGLGTSDKAADLIIRGWAVFDRLHKAHYPTVALIRGHCLGGGLELALACRYRLVVEDPGTLLALPEVKLGLFPGWGGIRRLPQLIGAPAALDMMLTGRAVDARKAVKLGLADGVVAPRLMKQAARMLVLGGKAKHRARGIPALMNHRIARPLVAIQARRKLDARDPHKHYPAPRAILEIWERHDGNALTAPELLDTLIRSDTAGNLLRLFHLQERLKALGKQADADIEFTHVHVVGAGVMGGDIAAWCACKGLTVTLQDQGRDRIATAQGRAHDLFKRKLKDARDIRAAADRLIPDMGGDGLRHADLVIEAITENADLKRELYSRIEPLMKADAILATNTSSLSIHELASTLGRPERFIGLHFFNPVAKMPLVEVVATPLAEEAVKKTAYAFATRIDKLPLPVSDSPGFLVNAVLAPYMLEAMRCVDEGIKPEAVDAAALAFGMPMGPIELIDTVGLDIARDAGQQLSGGAAMPRCLEDHLARNELGRKSGHGFYAWKAGKPVKHAAGPIPRGLAHRLLDPLINTTAEKVRLGVVADADLADAGVVFGTGFAPFTGGPMHYQDKRRGTQHAAADPLSTRKEDPT